MTTAPRTVGPPDALELLDRAIGYTRGALALVHEDDLGRRTPCARWTLLALLRHMDDSLAAMGEAAQATALGLAPAPAPTGGVDLLASIRQRACTLVGQWSVRPAGGSAEVAVGGSSLARETFGAVGALEITLHGWDVAEACGVSRPIPPGLALDLWAVAQEHIADADRPHRFGPVVDVPEWAGPQVRLLARAGRRA
jgi:uncharacterized protein (TIGR03086 family)